MLHVYSKYKTMKKDIRYLAIVEIQRVARGFMCRLNRVIEKYGTETSKS